MVSSGVVCDTINSFGTGRQYSYVGIASWSVT